MARLQSGVTPPFTNGQTLTASDLNNHVTGASPLPDFIGLQTGLTTPASADEFLINDVSDGAVKKVTLENLAANMPATTVNALTVSTNAAVTGNLTVGGNTTVGDADTDSATFNAASSFGATATFNKPVVLNDNSTIGQTVISGTYARSTTTMTVTKVAHGLTTGNTFWFNVDNNPTLSGSYSITVTNVDTFTFTVANSGATSGNIYWYAKTATIQSTLAGTVQGDIVVNVAKTNVANGDEFLIKDSSDSNKLKTVPFVVLPRLYGNVAMKSADTTTVGATVTRSAGSGTATVTKPSHGLRVGDVLYINLTGTGTLADGWYDVKTVPTSGTFTIQTANTTALASVSAEWYSLSVANTTGIYSAFKSSLTGGDVLFNMTSPMADTNYAIIATPLRNDTYLYAPACANIVGATGFDRTVNQFSLTMSYAQSDLAGGNIMFTLFGNV